MKAFFILNSAYICINFFSFDPVHYSIFLYVFCLLVPFEYIFYTIQFVLYCIVKWYLICEYYVETLCRMCEFLLLEQKEPSKPAVYL
jgi:hypothetical protein